MSSLPRPPALAVLLTLLVPSGPAEADWLPPEVAEGAARQLTERMNALVPGNHDQETLLASSREVIGSMRSVLDSWGVEGTLEHAPAFPRLEIPSASEPHLDAMAGYQVCNLLLALQLQDETFQDDTNARLASIFGLSAVTLAVIRLREPFLDAGGDMAHVEEHLAGSALEPVFEAIQTQPETRRHVEDQCRPMVHALLEQPLSRLDEASSE